MAMQGETIHLGADPHCSTCGKLLKEEVMQSAAGYFIGTQCCMGPNSRESEYMPSREYAQLALDDQLVPYRTSEISRQLMNTFALHGGFLSPSAMCRDMGNPPWVTHYLAQRDPDTLIKNLILYPNLILIGYSEGGNLIGQIASYLPNIKGVVLYESPLLEDTIPSGSFPVLWIRNNYRTLRYREEEFLDTKYRWQRTHYMETLTGSGRHIKWSSSWPFFSHAWDQSLNPRIKNWIDRTPNLG